MKENTGNINELIAKRYSPLAFDKRSVEKEKINKLFEAARWAPSSRNEQPWRFIFAERENKDSFNRMLETLAEGNKIWARDVPLLILSIALLNSSFHNRPNPYAFHDTGMAVGNLLIQATEMGIYAHQMGGYDKEMARKNLNIPEEYAPVAMIAVGYRGNTDNLSEELQKREQSKRERMPLDKIVFENRWADK